MRFLPQSRRLSSRPETGKLVAAKIDSDRKRKKASISVADRNEKEKHKKKSKMSSSNRTSGAQVRASHILIKHQGSRRKASWKDPEGRIIMNTT